MMKRTIILLIAGLLVFGPGRTAMAQDSKEEKAQQEAIVKREKEIKERKEFIEQEQMEAMREHERAMAEARIYIEELGDLEDMVIDIDHDGWRMPVMVDGDAIWFGGGQESQTQLTLRNSFRGGTDSSSGSFEVEEGTRRFRCMITGKVRSGEITIKVTYPDGKVFKDMTINSSAEVTFSQSVNIEKGDPDKYIGSWEYEVSAEKAEGNYTLQISTN